MDIKIPGVVSSEKPGTNSGVLLPIHQQVGAWGTTIGTLGVTHSIGTTQFISSGILLENGFKS